MSYWVPYGAIWEKFKGSRYRDQPRMVSSDIKIHEYKYINVSISALVLLILPGSRQYKEYHAKYHEYHANFLTAL